jgi:MscS family membrane protein
MSIFFRKISISLLCLASALPLAGQNPLSQILQPANSAQSKPATSTDSLERSTPSGTVFGFLHAAEEGNYSIAAQYLQMSPARRLTEGEQLATSLQLVVNRACADCNLNNLSKQPEGTLQEGVPAGRQKIGVLSSGDVEVDFDLVRVSDPNAGKIWLISSDTLAKVPEIYDQVAARQVASAALPKVLVKNEIGGLPLWQWLVLIIAVPVAALVSWLFLTLCQFPIRWWARRRGQQELASWRSVPGPAWLIAGTLVHRAFAAYLGLPLLQRHYYFVAASIALIIGANWILWRGTQWFLNRVRLRALAHGHSGTGSLMMLGERFIKAAIFVMAVLAVLGRMGFNMTTALAGLGIGGLAIGFGAQKTIENLFGGISVLGDEVIRVGDVCRFGDRTGTVEDIGLRSTRVRTEERTLLAIPNGTVATINVENLSRRDKLFFTTSLSFHPDTTSDHLRVVLAEIRRLLYSHPKVEGNTIRVRLIDISSGSPKAELLSYILTRDYGEYAAVKEDLLLRMMDIVSDAGASLASTSQTLYVGRAPKLEKEKIEDAARKVAELRDKQKLPFPNFSDQDISSFQGSIDYPPQGSAQVKPQSDSGRNAK